MTRKYTPPPDLAERIAAAQKHSKARANQPARTLWLATDDNEVVILRGDRLRARRYAGQKGLTILKSDEQELNALAQRGARLTVVPKTI